jgi:hypothetical protein
MRATTRCALIALGSLIGCRVDAVTAEEAQQALEESSIDSQAAALSSASFELSTNFTIGDAAENAAQHIYDFVQSQLPCAKLTLQGGATLTIEYGAQPGNCTFHGHTFQGKHTIEVARNQTDGVIVKHSWDKLGNGRISVTGDAEVTWSSLEPSRHVVHHLTWTRLADGRTGTGSGDRVQKPLPGGIVEGFSVDGTRSWQGQRGGWDLEINHIETRWTDPVPQNGSFVLHTPANKTITLVFERIDSDTIGVTASGGHRSIALKVNSLGTISRR